MTSRRTCLAALGGTISVAIGGCVGKNEPRAISGEDRTIQPVDVGAEDHPVDDPHYRLRLTYHTETDDELPREVTDHEPKGGYKFVILFAEVRVSSIRGDELYIPNSVIGLHAGDTAYEAQRIPSNLSIERSVLPPTTYEGSAYFEIPEDVSEATLFARNPGVYFDSPAEVLFELDPTRWST